MGAYKLKQRWPVIRPALHFHFHSCDGANAGNGGEFNNFSVGMQILGELEENLLAQNAQGKAKKLSLRDSKEISPYL